MQNYTMIRQSKETDRRGYVYYFERGIYRTESNAYHIRYTYIEGTKELQYDVIWGGIVILAGALFSREQVDSYIKRKIQEREDAQRHADRLCIYD